MAAVFGVINTHGLVPASGFAQESTKDASVEILTIRNLLGVTVTAKAKRLITKSVTLSGKGTANFALVIAGAISKSAFFITSSKVTESNDDFPSFEIQATIYDDTTV